MITAPEQEPSRVPPTLDRLAQISWRILLLVLAVAVVGYVVAYLRLLVIPILMALVLASVLHSPVRWLRDRRVPRALAVAAVLLAALLILGGLVALLAPPVAAQLDDLGESLTRGVERVLSVLDGWVGISETDPRELAQEAVDVAGRNAGALTGGVVAGAVLVGEVIAGLFLTLVFLFFFLRDGDRIAAGTLRLFPRDRRAVAEAVGRRSWSTLASYVRGLALVALVDAVLIGTGLLVIGVPLVLPLAILTFVGGFVPVVGATTMGLVATLVALVSGGLTDALLTVAVVLAVQQVDAHVLQPAVLGRSVDLHPLAVLSALTVGAVVAGIPGLFLAVPLVAVAVGAVRELHEEEEAATPRR